MYEVIPVEGITNLVTTFRCITRRSWPKTNNKFSLFISIITPIYFKEIFVTNQYKILGVSNSLYTSGNYNYLDCFCSQTCVERLYTFHITKRVMCTIVRLLYGKWTTVAFQDLSSVSLSPYSCRVLPGVSLPLKTVVEDREVDQRVETTHQSG